MITIPKENHLYHLSYDLKELKGNEEEQNNRHLQLKKDIVWEILIHKSTHYIESPVASTIIFDSPLDFDFWKDLMHNFADSIFYVLSEVSVYSEDATKNEMSQVVHPNGKLESNFKTYVMDTVMDEQKRITNSGRKVTSKF